MTQSNPATTDPRPIHSSARQGQADSVLGTRNLMTVAALSVVGMIILLPLNYLAPATGVTSTGAVFAGVAIMGLWVIPYLLPATVVRRPGAVIIAALIMGIISVFTTPSGPGALVGNLLGGAFIEVPLALMLYRKWTWWSFLISAAVFGLINGTMYIMLLKEAVGLSVSLPLVVVSIISALVGGAITIGLTRLLNNAGVGIDNRA
ncbi:ECF transporter S component [Actinomyces oricola]|uniref:ECF transporter S component n=1 Tax=Actinomyces oricola TaxID=206043 RepID=UPI000FFF28DD|nr:ECF transporter S component [Actinomyces oricola]